MLGYTGHGGFLGEVGGLRSTHLRPRRTSNAMRHAALVDRETCFFSAGSARNIHGLVADLENQFTMMMYDTHEVEKSRRESSFSIRHDCIITLDPLCPEPRSGEGSLMSTTILPVAFQTPRQHPFVSTPLLPPRVKSPSAHLHPLRWRSPARHTAYSTPPSPSRHNSPAHRAAVADGD